jgi:uncharacterized membrane protein YczE
MAGLVLFGLSLALLVKANLGLDPWNVFSQGVSKQTGLTLGQVVVLSSLAILACWIPLRQRPGLGTVANSLVVGPVLDLGLEWFPEPRALLWRSAALALSIVGVAVATGLYVGAGWGAGPRDGLMTGIAALGVPVFVARAGIEVTVLAIGWLLGGQVGVGTVVFALVIGPLVGRFLAPLRITPRPAD